MGRKSKKENGHFDNERSGRRNKGMGRNAKKESGRFDNRNDLGRGADGTGKPRNFSSYHDDASESQTLLVRKQIDPETTKYFSEIANVIESSEMDLEERSVICGNAIDETRGKELEIATDYILSHTLQTLLEGCEVDKLCGFLRNSAGVFPSIAMDRSGSHVAESALQSLSKHLEDPELHPVVEETLTKICKVIVADSFDVMCNSYGSHVLRRLLCLCKGVPLEFADLRGTKSSSTERFNLKASRMERGDLEFSHQGFPELLNFLVSGILECTRNDIKTLQVDQFSCLVLQTALKLLMGTDDVLLQIIPLLLGCKNDNLVEGNYIEKKVIGNVVELMKETAFSHLMEVILEVAPESLYDEMLNKIFRNLLFKLSSHYCGNFVVQALISNAKGANQLELIWEELGPKFKDLLEQGKSGVVASLIATSRRLHSHEHKCCQALAAAAASNESPASIVPRILFLDIYFSCNDKSNWKWASGSKMHLMGSLILQEIFKFPNDYIQEYITSITAMEPEHVFETTKNAGGARVVEAFLSSNASAKQKRRLVMKLRGHFGELAMHPSGSFTVDKCFSVANLSLREAIASDLLAVRSELSKTRQGPELLRRLDVDGFAAKPDQWRSRQESKQSTYNEFYAAFGSSEQKTYTKDSFVSDAPKQASHVNDMKTMRKDIDLKLASTATASVKSVDNDHKPFLSTENKGKKRGNQGLSKASNKKHKI